jgi:hypothetical protein
MANGNDSPPGLTASADPPLSRAVILAVLATSAVVAGFAISTQSYWIDEATSLIVAMAPDTGEAWKYAQAVGGSTIQMPLYHLYLYAWHKVFGGGEWMMRASNLPWLVFGQLAFLILLRDRPRVAVTACLLALVSPTLWMYLDEARPYLMQYGAACWFVAALAARTAGKSIAPDSGLTRGRTAAFAAALVVLFSSSLLGVLWAGGFLLALGWLRWREDRPAGDGARPERAIFVAVALLLAVAAAFYLWTWPMAQRGYHRAGTGLMSLPYIAYEFLGFSGFGPGKLQLRASSGASLLLSLPTLFPLAAVLALLGVFALRQMRPTRPAANVWVAWLLALGLPSALILGVFVLSDYRPLPRHFMPVLPAVILALAMTMDRAIAQPTLLWRTAAALLPLLWLGSSLNLRWQPAHAKDDYRTAAAMAAAALRANKEVWWAADAAAAFIYFTPVAMEEVPGRAWAMQAPSWDDIRFKFPPRVIVISKPDIYDPQGAIARYAAENQFSPAHQLQAFTIFTRHGEPLPEPAAGPTAPPVRRP